MKLHVERISLSSRAGNSRVVAERYELSHKLGSGGMAEVYLGTDRVLGRPVAVKMLLTQFAEDPQFIARFRREAQSAAALNHPNVVGVYDTGSDDGTHYIVMEYVEGKTLRDLIRTEGPLLPERAAEIAADVCAGLAFAHSRGIVHRDVKPGNIMLTADGTVKVTDFGIARAVSGEAVTQTATVLGTAQYFSPEQAQGLPVDVRSDVYSLGVVLYEMITRQVPFTGSSPVAIAYKHVKETPIAPSRLNPDVDRELEAIAMKALAKNPANRYQSSQEMREDLVRWLQGRPVGATPLLDDATSVVSPLAEETVVVSRGTGTPGYGEPSVRTVDEDARTQRRRAAGYLILALITMAIIGVLVWALAGAFSKPELVRVPSVVGERLGRAQDVLQGRGFEVRVADGIPSEEFEEGRIVDQEPAPGTRLEKGKTVTITPSTGPALVAVPEVTGKSEDDARSLIKKSGLKVGAVTYEPHETIAKGTVISQSPPSGTFLNAGRPVSIVVSSGKPTAIVPEVIGETEADARRRIEERGLRVIVEREPSSFECQQVEGDVCRQDPDGGTEVPRGSRVTIVVAEEPSPSPTPTEPSPTASPSPGF